MAYYEVYVGDTRFWGKEALTYSGPAGLSPGTLVTIPLRNVSTVGIIFKNVPKPKFTTKTLIVNEPQIILPDQTFQFLNWLAHYYVAPIGAVAQLFLPPSMPTKALNEPMPQTPPARALPPLTDEQTAALHAIPKNAHHTVLLHGDTGSGKTRIYLDLAKRALDKGKNALVLTPEIGLTTQLSQIFEEQFPGRVIVYHSNLTPLKRRLAWQAAAVSKHPHIIIGTRSALFLPFHNLGLLAVDEAHEPAYKQDQTPRYHALRAASFLAHVHHAQLVFGTATPLVSEYYLAQQKSAKIIRMSQLARPEKHELKLEVIPINDRQHFSSDGYLSNELLAELKQTLKEKAQALLFLNRRGTARAILCQNCGWRATCPNCSLPLTYHGDKHELRCHTCGHREEAPLQCPVCKSTDIIFRTLGTKALVELLSRHFPSARIQRFDTDNLTAERLEKHIQSLKTGQVDFIVGTQVLAKGLDLPLLRLVAVIQADISLQLPDFSSEERTFELLNQVVGRVGRGHRSGVIVVQSHNPDNPAIQAALSRDYDGFYKAQLPTREAFHFPPYYFMLALKIGRATRSAATAAAERLRDELRKESKGLEIIGPSPCFYEQYGGKFHWQLVIKSRNRARLQKIAAQLPSGWTFDLDPTTLL